MGLGKRVAWGLAASLVCASACASERPPRARVPASRAEPRPSPSPSIGGAAPEPAAEDDAGEAALAERYRGHKALSVSRGRATYYGAAFAGRPTASGERFDPARFTAAHRTLPFGTVVRVVRADGRRSVYVRITDRGPYGDHRRIIDLSRAAAAELDMLRSGVTDVRLEVLEYGRRKKRR